MEELRPVIMSKAQALIAYKMRAALIATPVINGFLNAVQRVEDGATGLVRESEIEPIESLAALDAIEADADDALLTQLAVIKLNGGLGTGMGLGRAKSLIAVKDGNTFLDFIARQILDLRRGTDVPAFYLLDSAGTQRDTLDHLEKYHPYLAGGQNQLDFLQNMVPKIDASTFEPVTWSSDPALEWCPPGHGDIYAALLGSGLLDRLLNAGVKFLFSSNADNLGAAVDLKLLRYFADSNLSFLMEVADRTAADRKGGHLARRRSDGRLVLRESAQCHPDDEQNFQDVTRHRFFNTNNLWIRLDHLQTELSERGGALPLPLIRNSKTVDPRDPSSVKVLQLESAMGAAIECFERAGAIVVPRARFAPVKSTSDLLALRSDAYRVTEDFRLVLDDLRLGQPPVVNLDSRHYQLLDGFERCFPGGAPSLIDCAALTVTGNVRFDAGVVCRGRVEFVNASDHVVTVCAGTYTGTVRLE